MVKSLSVAIAFVVYIGLVKGWQETLHFNDCFGIHYANDDKSFLVKWFGENRGDGCRVTFKGYDSSDALDKYKICIKATKWDIQSSDVTLIYYSNEEVLEYDEKKRFTRYSTETPKDEWCSGSDEYGRVLLSTSSSSSGSIELKVYAVKTVDYGKMIGIIVGSVIGGLVLLGIIVTVIIIIACNRRKGMSGTVLTNQNRGGQILSTPQTGITTTSQTGTQPMTEFANNAYSSPPPAYNQKTGYTYSGQQQYTGEQMVPKNPS